MTANATLKRSTRLRRSDRGAFVNAPAGFRVHATRSGADVLVAYRQKGFTYSWRGPVGLVELDEGEGL